MTVPYIGSVASVQEFLEHVKEQYMNTYRTSIELPNGELITSVQQIQEYFNER